jgi:hypothetical protein
MTDLNLSSCPETKYYKPKILSTPNKTCSAGHSLQYSDNHSDYKGPFLNFSFSNIPSSAVIIKPPQSLSEMSNINIPVNLSWRTGVGIDPTERVDIEDGRRNQGNCGCCWAMAFVSALGDRYAKKHKIKTPYPSAMWMISCGGTQIGSKGQNGSFAANRQCSCGGSIYGAGIWLEEGNSIGKESCWPYTTVSKDPASDKSYIAPICPNQQNVNADDCCFDCCGNPDAKIKFTVEKNSTKPIIVSNDGKTPNPDQTILAIKLDIQTNGPVATTFMVPDDFENWWNSDNHIKNNDIYTPTSNKYLGGHAVVLTGWGIENGYNYWEVRNSWGKPAFCRFRMSTDIDKSLWTGIDISKKFPDGSWEGGPVSVLPGELVGLTPGSKPEPKPGSSPGQKQGSKSDNKIKRVFKNLNWKIIGIIGIAILLVLIIISFVFKK